MLATFRYAARDAAKRTAFGFLSVVFIIIGSGFLSVAAWLAIAAATDALTAALVIGSAYMGVGLILAALAARRTKVPLKAAHPPGNASIYLGIAEALAAGIAAGQSTRSAVSGRKPNGSDDPRA